MNHTYIDEYSDVHSFLNRLDPRIKVVSFFALIISVILTRAPMFPAYACFGMLIAILIALSKIPLAYILKRSFVIMPFALMVAIFAPFCNQNGTVAAGNILIKAYLSIVCLILLTASTNFSSLLKAFEALKFPRLITMVISFMYRYVFVVQDELMKIRQAKESRSVARPSVRSQVSASANMVGILFIRTYERAEAIYLAMCARGFDGQMRTVNKFKTAKIDWFFLSTLLLALLGIQRAG
jgi:cobalt/nickel transport system permease protein